MEPDRESVVRDLALKKCDEINEAIEEWLSHLKNYASADVESDEASDAEVGLHVTSSVILAKCQSLLNIFDDEEIEEPELILHRLEALRSALGRTDRPLSVESFLSEIARVLKVEGREMPAAGTYWRWLKEVDSGRLSMSSSHQGMFKRCLDKFGRAAAKKK
jgi:hypothetical protein